MPDSESAGTVAISKRKVSCLQCRTRKVKCDGHSPCLRCVKRQESCTYGAPGKVGRPAKNSVVNKYTRNQFKQDRRQRPQFYTDIIFETLSYTIHSDTKYMSANPNMTMGGYLQMFFTGSQGPIMQLAQARMAIAIPSIPDIVMGDLTDLQIWLGMEVVNVIVHRASRLRLSHFQYYDAMSAAAFLDLAFKYVCESMPMPLRFNPLSGLDQDEAVRLIDLFFTISPHAFLLNKTLVMQGFWMDTIEPLLLSTILGTADYFGRLLRGEPVRLWGATDPRDRNVYLEYSYSLLNESLAVASFAKFQASVLLGLFDTTFGLPKRGMGALALSVMLARSLGVFDGTFQGELSDVEDELIRTAFWCTFNATTRGCVDHGHLPDFSALLHNFVFPPCNVEQSKSYALERSNGHTRGQKHYEYIYESFYVNSVICKFTNLILREFPEVEHNMFRGATPKRTARCPEPHDLQIRINTVLESFKKCIDDLRHTWSPLQLFMIESAYRLFTIHMAMMKPVQPLPPCENFGNSMFDVFVKDYTLDPQEIVPVLPKVYLLLDEMLEYAALTIGDEHPPQHIMATIVDTALDAMMRAPPGAVQHNYFLVLDTLLNKIDHLWVQFDSISEVRQKLQTYLERQKINDALLGSASAASLSPMTASMHTASIHTPESQPDFSVQEQLGMAAFFDPLAVNWVDAAALQVPVDMRLLLSPAPSAVSSTFDVVRDLTPVPDDFFLNVTEINGSDAPTPQSDVASADPSYMLDQIDLSQPPINLSLSFDHHHTFSSL
ncbi:hypothetical protein BC940DRAFT_258782 [Gongronella butleri]|nr:hypothetical protein BC940DRAFT_258782 [Gongronella butleri]